ncbi:hypothetical protein [Fulvivirga sediminis]|uniref:Uncharacterized protein n=1 Tax=Fulvivirga sediminis TaxID=2803949 RepID=A0A937F6F0_9BACT|nr:hypothetical protein [Fulvivirga sediminis]MBL3655114.1 hypothetical protein [Fulvivirga sediminis]
MINLNLKNGIVLLLVSLMSSVCLGQTGQATSVPYYIDLNNSDPSKVYQIIDGECHIKYFDKEGKDDFLNVTVFNWKHEKVANYSFGKTYGLNHYLVKMDWLVPNQIYFIEAIAEGGQSFQMVIQGTEKLKLPLPHAEIIVNPLALSCEPEADSSVEYYVDISGGRSPYEAQWYVMDEHMVKLLYQPRKEIINEEGKGMMVVVDKSPSYHVLLKLTDACGNELKRMVSISCGEKDKVFHSIFVEPVALPNAITTHIR